MSRGRRSGRWRCSTRRRARLRAARGGRAGAARAAAGLRAAAASGRGDARAPRAIRRPPRGRIETRERARPPRALLETVKSALERDSPRAGRVAARPRRAARRRYRLVALGGPPTRRWPAARGRTRSRAPPAARRGGQRLRGVARRRGAAGVSNAVAATGRRADLGCKATSNDAREDARAPRRQRNRRATPSTPSTPPTRCADDIPRTRRPREGHRRPARPDARADARAVRNGGACIDGYPRPHRLETAARRRVRRTSSREPVGCPRAAIDTIAKHVATRLLGRAQSAARPARWSRRRPAVRCYPKVDFA